MQDDTENNSSTDDDNPDNSTNSPAEKPLNDGKLLFQYSIIIEGIFKPLVPQQPQSILSAESDQPNYNLILSKEGNKEFEIPLTPRGSSFKNSTALACYKQAINQYCKNIKYLTKLGINYKANSLSIATDGSGKKVNGPIRAMPII